MPDATRAQRALESRQDRPSFPFEGFGPEEFELPAREEEPVLEKAPNGRRTALVGVGTRAWARAAWLGLAVVLAFGSAGVVAAMSPLDEEHRQELTYSADRDLQARLDEAAVDLAALNVRVTNLGDQARRLVSSLTQVDRASLAASYTDGAAALADIDRLAGQLGSDMECASLTAERMRDLERSHSGTLVADWQRLCLSLESVVPLDGSWQSMVDGSKVAMGVADAIAQHDQLSAQALQLATQGRYSDALLKIAEAGNALDGARQLSVNLTQVGRDVSTLNEWLTRIDGMDLALRTLWQEMINSGGKITAPVTAALKGVGDAQALLPASNAILSVVLYELAGGLLGEGISIEQAKGQLASALAALTPAPSPTD